MILTPNIGFKSVRGKKLQGREPVYESETIAYMYAIGIPDNSDNSIYGITNNAVWVAVDNYFKGVSGFKSKLLAVYLMIGGSAAVHKFNAFNPVDTDAAFRMVFFGSGTHTYAGFITNGTNAYGNSKLNQLNHSELNNESISFYTPNVVSGGVDSGVFESGGGGTTLILRDGSAFVRFQSSTERTFSPEVSQGLFQASRINSTEYKVSISGEIMTQADSTTTLKNLEFHLGKINGSGVWSNRTYSYYSIGKGLTESEMVAHETAVQNLQVELNRSA